jgi:hypothetical protein
VRPADRHPGSHARSLIGEDPVLGRMLAVLSCRHESVVLRISERE